MVVPNGKSIFLYESKINKPPKDNTFLIGVFKYGNEFILNNCLYKNKAWWINDDNFIKDDPIFWTYYSKLKNILK